MIDIQKHVSSFQGSSRRLQYSSIIESVKAPSHSAALLVRQPGYITSTPHMHVKLPVTKSMAAWGLGFSSTGAVCDIVKREGRWVETICVSEWNGNEWVK